MKKVFEKIIEGMLTCSGFVTSITILLIVLFLFTEAFGLFKSKVIEEGYVLALNKSNKVSVLSPAQIKNVFDEEAIAMSVVLSIKAEIPTPVPPPVTVTRASGCWFINRSAVCCATGSTVSLPFIRCALAPSESKERAINKFLLTFIFLLFIDFAN